MQHTPDYKIAIIGPAGMVSGFLALGAESFPASTSGELLEQLRYIKQLTVDESKPVVYAVVCVIEDLMVDVDQAEYNKLVSGPLPAVVILPGPQGSQGQAAKRLRQLAERAVGAAII